MRKHRAKDPGFGGTRKMLQKAVPRFGVAVSSSLPSCLAAGTLEGEQIMQVLQNILQSELLICNQEHFLLRV